jgi:transposase InsO family protein
MAAETRQKGIIHHSDYGIQYTSHEYQREINNYRMVCSMSRKVNCWDNAVVERFFGSLKTERVDLRQYNTRQQGVIDFIDYIVMFFYNSNSYIRILVIEVLPNLRPKDGSKRLKIW